MLDICEYRSDDVYVCWADISGIDPNDIRGFSKRRIQRLTEIKRENERIRSAGAERMLIHAVSEMFPQIHIPLEYEVDDLGKPFLPNMSGIYFNLSHSGDIAVCAVSNIPVGVDVQQQRRINKGIAAKYYTEAECEYVGDNSVKFSRIWARKEAVSKAVGKGLQIGFGNIEVLGEKTEYNGKMYSVSDIECGFDGYFMALSHLITV